MRSIKLMQISIDNFKSFAQPTRIDFPQQGFLFLGGRNEVEPRLGANGAGKSSLWDALFYCLYGTSIKGDKAGELVTWHQKRPVVAVTLLIDGGSWTFERAGCPEKLSLQNARHTPAQATQLDFDRLLGLTKARFAQSVLFGQGARFFLDLTVPERGALLDEVLDLSLWERLAKRAADSAKTLELEQTDARRDIAFVSGKLEGLTDSTQLADNERRWRADLEAELLALCDAIELQEALHTDHQASLDRLDAGKPLLDAGRRGALTAARQSLSDLQQTIGASNQALRDMKQQAEFYEQHTDCPTCKQALSPAFIKAQQADLLHRLDEAAKLRQGWQQALAARQKEIDLLEQAGSAEDSAQRDYAIKRSGLVSALAASSNASKGLMASMTRKEAQLEQSPYAAQLAALAANKAALEEELAQHQSREQAAQAAFRHMDYWRQGFKKIKLFIIKQTLSMLEIETAAAAAALGLPGWTIKYVTEVETKSGTLKSGVQIAVSSPQASGNWSIWSGGESQRIRVAISLGLSSMIQRLAGVDYGFEIWDEPSAWLSAEGIADLMECLHYRADMTGKALWVVDHRAFDAATFDGVYIIVKTEAGSNLEVA